MIVTCGQNCIDHLSKVFQILVIIAIVLYIVNLYINLGMKSVYWLVIFIVIYLFYFASEISSTVAMYLRNKTNTSGIKNIMENLIRTPPTIEFSCECYHYSTKRTHSPPRRRGGGGRKRSSGHRIRHGGSRTIKIYTHRETVSFPYYSARDFSGLFEINNSRESAMGKVYVKLELTPEINFADELSYMDYEIFRTNFYNVNRPRDKYMNYRETRSVSGLQTYNFVCIKDSEPCGINIYLFCFFTIILVSVLYKCYVNSYCLEQKFKIRKLISTRYNLNEQEQYQNFVPSFNVPTEQYAFKPDNYNYINNNYNVQNPSNEDINRASIYKDKIPKYECVSYTSITLVGIVKSWMIIYQTFL